jgi:transcription-repair coupling factor (superfamily II helicase)
MLEKVLKCGLLRQGAKRLAAGGGLRLSGVWGSSAPLVAAALGRMRGSPVLFVAAHLDDADDAADDLEVLAGLAALLFPAWELDLLGDHLNDEVAGERLRVCDLLSQSLQQRSEHPQFIVASIMALMQPVPSPEALAQRRLTLLKDQQIEPDDLVERLIEGGFERVEAVDQQGQFARRGGILDVFPHGSSQPLRVEFFGDRIESIRHFDLDTQRSVDRIEGCELLTVATAQPELSTTASLMSYLPKDTLVCILEPSEVAEVAHEIHTRLHDAGAQRGLSNPEAAAYETAAPAVVPLLAPEDCLGQLRRFQVVAMHAFRPPDGQEALNLGIRSLGQLSSEPSRAIEELGELSATEEVWIYCETPAEEKRFNELLASQHPALVGRFRTAIRHVHSGFAFPSLRLIVAGHHEIFHRYAKRRRLRQIRAGRPIESLLDLHPGDYVVHVSHGIARFQGLRTLERDGRSEEFLTLRFANNALLHVPASFINLVQKYVGSRHFRPSLSKLGGVAWSRQKQRVREAVSDLAADLLRIQALRRASPGFSFPAGSPWQRQFAEEFIYSQTADQIAAMEQIDSDMVAARPMDRLLCGDVGYGKTELAMRAAFKAAEAGKQAVVLVPTTVLADQHRRTFGERFADYPMHVEVLSRFRSPAEQEEILKRLAAGEVDIVIGTHRLLSKDVRFADLGLVVIDEEQRFGVRHKEHLKGLRAHVDVLTMTATPIPRTLHMALMGLRDISSLATPPLDRRAIYTEVCHYDQRLIRHAILRELNRQGQVFFVHNRVYDIQPLADGIRDLVGEARVAVAHGQMPEHTLEKTMLAFVRGQIDVLVCTTIIESGLDIPAANTIIIHEADRFGLAELHQLRGRVGRYKHRAYCYLLLPERRTVSPAAARRLKAIEEFSDLGAGFQIAMRDLEIRGAGNILGAEQSGHIAAVGYELYCQLLEQAVNRLRGQERPARREAHVELGLDAYIPKSYVPSDRQRMEAYRQLGRCASREDIGQLRTDLTDAYGPIPPAVDVLLDQAEIRLLAGELGIESVILMDRDVVLAVSGYTSIKGLFHGVAGSVRLPDERTVHWRPPPSYLAPTTLVPVLLKRLRLAHAAV